MEPWSGGYREEPNDQEVSGSNPYATLDRFGVYLQLIAAGSAKSQQVETVSQTLRFQGIQRMLTDGIPAFLQ